MMPRKLQMAWEIHDHGHFLPDLPDVAPGDFRQCGSIASLFAGEHSQPLLALAGSFTSCGCHAEVC